MSFPHSIAIALLSIYPRVMKTYIHIRTSAVKGQIPRPTHMTFKHNAVPSITWRRISVCNTFEGHFLRIMLSGESQPPKVTSCWPIYITELQRFRASEQIREPEPGVKKGVTSYNSHVMELLYLRWPTGPTSDKLDRTKHTYTRTSSIWAQTF